MLSSTLGYKDFGSSDTAQDLAFVLEYFPLKDRPFEKSNIIILSVKVLYSKALYKAMIPEISFVQITVRN
jgi:hypothetical protein